MLARLDDLGLLAAIHVELIWDEWINEKIVSLQLDHEPLPEWKLSNRGGRQFFWRLIVYALWFIRLSPDHARGVLDRLKFAAEVRSDILQACKLWQELPELAYTTTIENQPSSSTPRMMNPPSIIATRLDGLSSLAIYTNYLGTDNPRVKEILHTYVTRWKDLRSALTGDDLRAKGIPPGPVYSRILTMLRNAWLDGEVSSAAQEEELLARLLREPLDDRLAEPTHPTDAEC
jgi:tRNA nucleotidyltransferase (CCA-adding enzyme)